MAPHKKYGDKDLNDGSKQAKLMCDEIRRYFKTLGVDQMGGNGGPSTAKGCAKHHNTKTEWAHYSAPSWKKLYTQIQREMSKFVSFTTCFNALICFMF